MSKRCGMSYSAKSDAMGKRLTGEDYQTTQAQVANVVSRFGAVIEEFELQDTIAGILALKNEQFAVMP